MIYGHELSNLLNSRSNRILDLRTRISIVLSIHSLSRHFIIINKNDDDAR